MYMEYQNENFKGIYEFRCRFHNGWSVRQHIHEFSELLYCQKGSCEILINSNPLTLSEKQFVWIPPNYIHQYNKTDASLICAVFSHDFIPLFFHMTQGKKLVCDCIDAGELCPVFDLLPSLVPTDLMQICAYLNQICAKVLEYSEFVSETGSDGILYQKVITYISNHFLEDISLKQLAKSFSYNEKYLSHTLHALTNLNFSELIAMYRVEYAKSLLGDPQLSIAEIAFASGFRAVNTFNRTFKKATGMTPSQFKAVLSSN